MRTYRLEIRLIQVAVGLALIVLIAGFAGLWEGGKAPAGPANPDSTATKPALSNLKIVALGDSFTLGYPLDPKYSWTVRAEKVLEVPVINKGKSRQTAKDLLDRFAEDVVAEDPGRVIIFAGIGDVLQDVTLEEFQPNIEALVEKAKSNDIIPILALPFEYPGVRDKIKVLREWEISYAQQEDILTLDFATVLLNTEGKYLDGLTIDEKYPNAKGYEVMGDYVAKVLK
ncbi:GDSL-type esterase/lipase family protein [Desulfosporosinus youngiae]|uniref:Lysophospholipase L1-like esterase n=1 Tax=Desulfosporosinus youngiae DSM 17734 TaxID=768710 RepID=H5Y046_9FIRM|nr:GDSL-type esterase/lipase family protein [Desulfosporosinus youngiae]EHQ91955.1 lysophospholipase L1-like esterase [Desulfosporosinus youngiae DSM 17734]